MIPTESTLVISIEVTVPPTEILPDTIILVADKVSVVELYDNSASVATDVIVPEVKLVNTTL